MRPRSVVTLALAAGLFVPAHASAQAAAQAGGSVLWLVRPAGRIELEKEIRGSLSAADYFTQYDAYFDVWEIQGAAGASVTFDMKSEDFDALLYLVGPGLAETLTDDDSGGRCDARLTVRFLEDGVYRVAAMVNGSRTTGVYTLLATTDPAPAPSIDCGGLDPAAFAALPVAGRIAVGDSTSGSLDAGDATLENGSHAEVWEITGQAGQTVRIRLQSNAFDSFLYVLGPGLDGMITDDDSGGDLHAEIEITFAEAGVYRIVVSSTEAEATGAYRLTVSR